LKFRAHILDAFGELRRQVALFTEVLAQVEQLKGATLA
jgi:hypothetical protein